jgi:hypothetical protein
LLYEIELHDSRVMVTPTREAVVLRLCPAYIHHWRQFDDGWKGRGLNQIAEIIITGGSVSGLANGQTFVIAGGSIKVAEKEYSNLIPASLETVGPVRCQLALMGHGTSVIEGRGIAVRLIGDPEHVENLPASWAPERVFS